MQQEVSESNSPTSLKHITANLISRTRYCLQNDDALTTDSAAFRLFADLESEIPEIRQVARSVLQAVVVTSPTNSHDNCGWLSEIPEFNPKLVESAKVSLRNGLKFERGNVMKFYLLAIGHFDTIVVDEDFYGISIEQVLMDCFSKRAGVTIEAMGMSGESQDEGFFEFCLDKISTKFVKEIEEIDKFVDTIEVIPTPATFKFAPGDKIKAKYRGKPRLYVGTIACENENGTYDINYDDGELEQNVKTMLIRPLENPSNKKTGVPDVCAVCSKTTTTDELHVIVCDGCNGEFHFGCLAPKMTKLPAYQWFCGECGKKEEWKSTVCFKSATAMKEKKMNVELLRR